MFGIWSTSKPRTRPIEIPQIERLAPLTGRSRAELHVATAEAQRRSVAAGSLELSSDDERLCFLEQGALQITARNGANIAITSDQQAAAFPLPPLSHVGAIVAREDCSLLTIPQSAVHRRRPVPPPAPELTSAEREARDGLLRHFASDHHELPGLPDLAMKIGAAIDSHVTGSDDIARLIQIDPVLSTRILSVVNSAAFGGVSQVTSIPQATTRLGRNKVRSLVFSCLLKNIFKVQSTALKHHMEALWLRSAHVAALSYMLAKVTPGIDPEQALLAGLIHDIGAIAVIGGIAHFPRLAEREGVFHHVLGELSAPLGTRILDHWHLLDTFGEALRGVNDWHRSGWSIADIADVVLIARLHATIGSPDHRHLPFIDAVPAFRKLADGELTPLGSLAVLERAAAEVREIQSLIAS
ncbi:MAG: HDOD domain-containing protein [Gammaproteobacteria bacterium]|nr:HDOD domain-containing protein [Gammaproteobacteria bacterium]